MERPLNEHGQALKSAVQQIQVQLADLESFDERDQINLHCDLLELDVGEAVQSAISHIEKIEKDLLAKIRQYRDKLLDQELDDQLNTNSQKSAKRARIKQWRSQEAELSNEVNQFLDEWKKYFNRASIVKTDDEVKAAQIQAQTYASLIQELQAEVFNEFSSENMMQYRANGMFVNDLDHLGQLEENDSDESEQDDSEEAEYESESEGDGK